MGFVTKSDLREEPDEPEGKPADRIDPDDHHSLFEYEDDT